MTDPTDTTTTTPRILPSDAPTPRRGSGKPRKPSATPKPKRTAATADLWQNKAGDPYLKLSDVAFENLMRLRAKLQEQGFDPNVATEVLRHEIATLMDKLPVLVAGKLSRALEGLKGGAGEGA